MSSSSLPLELRRPDGSNPRVLVVDDELALLRVLRIGLSARGFDVALAQKAAEGLEHVALWDPDVVVLDLGLPDTDGVELCRRLRSFSDVPVVVLSADGSEARKVQALDEGADDFVTKPFGMPELEARLRVALRHRFRQGGPSAEPEIVVGPIVVDLASRSVSVDGAPVDLTRREFDFLAELARHAGKVVTHRMLLQEVWGPEYGSETHYLRVYASRVRQKLGEAAGGRLQTVPGVGYQLQDG